MRSKLLLGVVFSLGVCPVQAQISSPVALGPMFEAAERVVWGHCREINLEPLSGFDNLPVTQIRFEVIETFKGTDQTEIRYQQFGRPGDRRFSHLPQCTPDEEVLIFLYPPSAVGLTSPVGVEQGLFRIHEAQGIKTLSNGRGNRGLFQGLERVLTRLSGSERTLVNTANAGSPMNFNLFTRILRSLRVERKSAGEPNGQ